MTVKYTFPNFKFALVATGEERTQYLTKLRDFYNRLNESGLPVPVATINGSGDSAFLELEEIPGNYIATLFQEGVITEDHARTLSPRVSAILERIKAEKGVTVYNAHTGNVVYDPATNTLMLTDLTQNTECPEFSRVRQLSPEFLAQQAKRRELEEVIEQLEQRIKELEDKQGIVRDLEEGDLEEGEGEGEGEEGEEGQEGQEGEQEAESESALTEEEKQELIEKRALLKQKKEELASL